MPLEDDFPMFYSASLSQIVRNNITRQLKDSGLAVGSRAYYAHREALAATHVRRAEQRLQQLRRQRRQRRPHVNIRGERINNTGYVQEGNVNFCHNEPDDGNRRKPEPPRHASPSRRRAREEDDDEDEEPRNVRRRVEPWDAVVDPPVVIERRVEPRRFNVPAYTRDFRPPSGAVLPIYHLSTQVNDWLLCGASCNIVESYLVALEAPWRVRVPPLMWWKKACLGDKYNAVKHLMSVDLIICMDQYVEIRNSQIRVMGIWNLSGLDLTVKEVEDLVLYIMYGLQTLVEGFHVAEMV
eukprot:scaffold24618_cov135-Amphora_coffeaeformis.AAC.2